MALWCIEFSKGRVAGKCNICAVLDNCNQREGESFDKNRTAVSSNNDREEWNLYVACRVLHGCFFSSQTLSMHSALRTKNHVPYRVALPVVESILISTNTWNMSVSSEIRRENRG